MNKKRIFIFAVMGVLLFALGVQLATVQPVEIRVGDTTIAFLPLIISSKVADVPPDVLYVFSSTATTNGNPGGRGAMNDICPTQDSDAHFCRLEEIQNAWITTGVYFEPTMSSAWVEQFPGGDWSNGSENCSAWTYDTSGDRGKIISANAFDQQYSDCDQVHAVACCKWMP